MLGDEIFVDVLGDVGAMDLNVPFGKTVVSRLALGLQKRIFRRALTWYVAVGSTPCFDGIPDLSAWLRVSAQDFFGLEGFSQW